MVAYASLAFALCGGACGNRGGEAVKPEPTVTQYSSPSEGRGSGEKPGGSRDYLGKSNPCEAYLRQAGKVADLEREILSLLDQGRIPDAVKKRELDRANQLLEKLVKGCGQYEKGIATGVGDVGEFRPPLEEER